MLSLLKKTMLSTTLLAAMLPMSSVAAEAPLPKEQDDAHMMMDHSPADAKGMRGMKDQKIPIHHTGDPVTPTDKPKEDHIMMDHSPADAKGMRGMKKKKARIHHSGDPVTTTDKPKEDHMMMDHSPADAKGMRGMKDKKIPIHHSEETPVSDAPATPDASGKK